MKRKEHKKKNKGRGRNKEGEERRSEEVKDERKETT